MLQQNYNLLKENNWLAPKGLGRSTAPLNHAKLAPICYNEGKDDDLCQFFYRKTSRDDFNADIRNKLRDIVNFKYSNYIFSCEHFSSRVRKQEEIARFRELFISSGSDRENFKIILVIRSQYDWHVSAYNTYIRTGGKLIFSAWLQKSIEHNSADWFSMISRWSAVFGTDSVVLLPVYDKNIPLSLEQRFLELCGVSPAIVQSISTTKRQNTSLTLSSLEQIRLINLDHEWMINGEINQVRASLIDQKLKSLSDSIQLPSPSNNEILSDSKQLVLDNYRQSNINLLQFLGLKRRSFEFLFE